MPRPMQILTWREFSGEDDGSPIEGTHRQGASTLQNLYLLPGQRGLVRRKGTTPLGAGNLSPNQDLDGLNWYKIGATEFVVSAHNGRLYDWLAGAQLTGSVGRLTSGAEANGAWIDSRFYWGDGIKQNVYHDGTDVVQALPDTPASAPTLAAGAAGSPNGTYLYVVTFIGADGQETAAGPSASITVANTKISLTNIPTCAAGQDCTARKVYRTKNGGTLYYLVTTIADNTTTTYTDNTADTALGPALRLNFDGETHSDLTRFPGCRYLIAHQNRLIGLYSTAPGGDKQTIYISKFREPWYCPVLPDFEDPTDGTQITIQGPGAGEGAGLCSHGTSVFVFTGEAAFQLITSDQLLDYQLHRFADHGCVAHRTIKSVKDALLWLAPDGVYLAREGQGVVRISDDEFNTIAAKSAATMAKAHAFVWDQKYFLCWPDGAVWYDLRNGLWGRHTAWTWRCSTVSAFSSAAVERIWAAQADNARVWQLEVGNTDAGAAIDAKWKSNAFDMGAPYREKRLYYISAVWKPGSGTATVNLYRETGSAAIQTATKDLADVAVTGAQVVRLDQRCVEQARGEWFEVEVDYSGSAADYQLLQVDVRFNVVT